MIKFVNQLRVTANFVYSTAEQKGILALCSLLWFCFLGCASLPDVSPFVDATTKVRKSVQSAAVVVEAELRDMGDDENAQQLRSALEKRNKAFDGGRSKPKY